MKKNRFIKSADQPLMHPCHKKPITRREFVSQGFAFGTGVAMTGSLAGLLSNPAIAQELNLEQQLAACGEVLDSDTKIPFICFDLAGGANFAGSSVLVGGPGGQEDFLSTSGYERLGLPIDLTPNLDSAATPFIDDTYGLKFHSDSPYLRGLKEFAPNAGPFTNGAVMPARSENDTGNNPHNPMYAINRAGADGRLLSLIGSRNSDSGGNSMAPMGMMNPSVRPTKIDSANDARGLVDTGDLARLLGDADAAVVMDAVFRLSQAKLGRVTASTEVINDLDIDAEAKKLLRCGYAKAAQNSTITPSTVNPDDRPRPDNDAAGIIVNDNNGIFSEEEYDEDREFRKTAAIMKLVIDGHAGAGTITMGGYDYHGGGRARGEERDLRAGRCIGAVLEYAHRMEKQVMIYVFSDGSLSSNGVTEGTAADPITDRRNDAPGGRGKGMWVSDNQQTACSWFLVYNPPASGGRPQLMGDGDEQFRHQQLGHFRANGSVETSAMPFANNVDLLVDAVALNYLALHGEAEIDRFRSGAIFENSPLRTYPNLEDFIAFRPIR